MPRQASGTAADALRKSLLLPQTRFPMRANAAKREPLAVHRLTSALYREQTRARAGADSFVLHDGPPYANGSLHMGHFLNKVGRAGRSKGGAGLLPACAPVTDRPGLAQVLKDIANRSNLLRGRRVEYNPGWDCHGLPIELRALQRAMEAQDAAAAAPTGEPGAKKKEKKKKKAARKAAGAGVAAEAAAGVAASHHVGMDPMAVRRLARELAQEAIDEQSRGFARWGVLAAWDDPGSWYRTMDPAYETAQLGVLAAMHARGLVRRAHKPVYWSPASRTALAEAELEYRDGHVSQAAYVRLPLTPASASAPALAAAGGDAPPALLVWTTTPWTLPANRAACVDPGAEYAVVRDPHGTGGTLIVASALVGAVERDAGLGEGALEVVARLSGRDLLPCSYAHPLEAGRECPVLPGDHVTMDAGTGVVHTAPGHGMEDYAAWHASAREGAFAPVDDAGRFTDAVAAMHPSLPGREVLGDGNETVLGLLEGSGALFSQRPFTHRYPYDWRSKQPVIVRATPQWFASLASLHPPALAAVQGVDMVPAASTARLEGMLTSRAEWCISRQRAWGVPIPAWRDTETGEVHLTQDTILRAQEVVGREGGDAWWQLPSDALLPPSLAARAASLERCEDTLDVWFDSGCSWAAVVDGRGLGGGAPADLYLEGSDQHRGWFQSSLLTHAAAGREGAPFRQLVTHGFVLDEARQKMSKSVGNVVDPAAVINGAGGAPAYGADVLRYWAAATDFTHDVVIGPTVVAKASESVRKLRNTARFCLGNLRDAPLPAPTASAPIATVLAGGAGLPAAAQLPLLDRYAVHLAVTHARAAAAHFAAHQPARFVSATNALVASDMSAFYCDAVKDTLYCDARDSPRRRAAQTALYASLRLLASSLAPVAPFTAQDIWAHLDALASGDEGAGGDDDPLASCASTVFDDALWADTSCRGILGPDAPGLDEDAAHHVGILRGLRDAVNAALEPLRAAKLAGGPADVAVLARVVDGNGGDAAMRALQAAGANGTVELLAVSQGHFSGTGASALLGNAGGALGADMWPEAGAKGEAVTRGPSVVSLETAEGVAEVEVEVAPAVGSRCDRCWRTTAMPVRTDAFGGESALLCARCADVAGAAK